MATASWHKSEPLPLKAVHFPQSIRNCYRNGSFYCLNRLCNSVFLCIQLIRSYTTTASTRASNMLFIIGLCPFPDSFGQFITDLSCKNKTQKSHDLFCSNDSVCATRLRLHYKCLMPLSVCICIFDFSDVLHCYSEQHNNLISL